MEVPEGIQFIVLIFLVFLSGYFSSAETAFSTVNRVRMQTLEEEGNKRAARVNRILKNYSKMLSAVLIGNNIVNLSTSALTTTIALQFGIPVAVATGVLTIVILLYGEIIPKTWAMLSSEKLTLAYSGTIYSLMQVMTPVIFVVDKMSNGILRILHIDPSKKITTMTEAELRTYVEVSHADGVIETEEREMIYNVFDFSDALAKDIMIPRINMVTVDINATFSEVMAAFKESMYTRFPVYEDDKDNIIGLINIKDFILTEDEENFQVKSILRDAHFTYEFKKVSDLLYELRERATSVTFVLNEYGATVGMITLEDLLEEIVGEIRDEYDADEEEFIQKLYENTYQTDTELESEDYDSIGGIIIENLDRLPEDNEEVTLADGIRLKVQGIEQNRIVKVLMVLPEKKTAEETSAQDSEAADSDS